MKKMKIFEAAMCCSTGLCGVGIDPELLRVSTVLNTLKGNGILVDRFNLNSAPMEFITNQTINDYINTHGPESLPVITIDEKIVFEGRYPTNEEFTNLLDLPIGMLSEQNQTLKVKIKKSGDCGCKGGCC